MYSETGTELSGNRVYGNGAQGIYICSGNNNLTLTGNTVYNNGTYGINDTVTGRHTVRNNLCYSNTDYNIRFTATGVQLQFEQNTVAGGKGVYFGNPGTGTNRNNIIRPTGTGNAGLYFNDISNPAAFLSDWNDLYATDNADIGYWPLSSPPEAHTLADWQNKSTNDANSISSDPLFVDAGDGVDFHLQSKGGSYHGGFWQADAANSPCIDAGDPDALFTAEPPYNGYRVNMGAYAASVEASRMDYTGVFYTVTTTVDPMLAGIVNVRPPDTDAFPDGYEVTLIATATNRFFSWSNWSGGLSGNQQTNVFLLYSNLTATAVFATTSNNTYGVPDWWLDQYGIPTTEEGAAADADGDGFRNWEEYYAGTIPTNDQSSLRITVWDDSEQDRHALTILTVSGKTYRLKSTPALTPPVWTNEPWSATSNGVLLDELIQGSGAAETLYVDPASARTYYRIQLVP